MPKVAGEKGKRSKKDVNAPKRNLSAYFLFCAEERDRVKTSTPNLSLGDTAKELGRRWAACDQTTKQKFEKLAAKDKERYEREKAAYKGGMVKGGKPAPAKASPAKGKAKGKAQKESDEDEDDDEDDDE